MQYRLISVRRQFEHRSAIQRPAGGGGAEELSSRIDNQTTLGKRAVAGLIETVQYRQRSIRRRLEGGSGIEARPVKIARPVDYQPAERGSALATLERTQNGFPVILA